MKLLTATLRNAVATALANNHVQASYPVKGKPSTLQRPSTPLAIDYPTDRGSTLPEPPWPLQGGSIPIARQDRRRDALINTGPSLIARLRWPSTGVKSFTFFCFVALCLWLSVPDIDMRCPLLVTGLLGGLTHGHKWSNDTLGPLKFKEDGTFQLSIFEDLHFGESKTTMPQNDRRS